MIKILSKINKNKTHTHTQQTNQNQKMKNKNENDEVMHVRKKLLKTIQWINI